MLNCDTAKLGPNYFLILYLTFFFLTLVDLKLKYNELVKNYATEGADQYSALWELEK